MIDKIVEEHAKNIVRQAKQLPVLQQGIRKPLFMSIRFEDTVDELSNLRCAAIDYENDTGDSYIAHGVRSLQGLCFNLEHGNVRMNPIVSHFGSLTAKLGDIQLGGYTNSGWGLFVTTQKDFENLRPDYQRSHMIRSSNFNILLPSEVVKIVQAEFPKYERQIFGYREFAGLIRDATHSH